MIIINNMYQEKIILLLEEHIKKTKKIEVKVFPESKFNSDLSIDSLDVVEILVSLEKHFELDLAIEELISIQPNCVSDLVKFIENKLKK